MNYETRPVKEGETFIVRGGQAYVGDDKVTIPQLSVVDVEGAPGQWEANLCDYFFDHGQGKTRHSERPRNHAMLSAAILVDVEERGCAVTVVQLYKPPVPLDCVTNGVHHFQHVPVAQVKGDTVINLSMNDREGFSKSLSYAFGRPINIRNGMTVAQLVSLIESAHMNHPH